MPPQSNTTIFNSIMRAASPTTAARKTHFSTTSYRGLANATPTAPVQTSGVLRRLAATPRGRVSIAAAVIIGCAIDYELWTQYGSKYFAGKE
ncbi:hypothetical protein GGR51DRAFT_525349 [Nemania sp. FL0031]|nr:hypothetical protein GGR51DRAFT_525349 [Nemania sp. FL0031]